MGGGRAAGGSPVHPYGGAGTAGAGRCRADPRLGGTEWPIDPPQLQLAPAEYREAHLVGHRPRSESSVQPVRHPQRGTRCRAFRSPRRRRTFNRKPGPSSGVLLPEGLPTGILMSPAALLNSWVPRAPVRERNRKGRGARFGRRIRRLSTASVFALRRTGASTRSRPLFRPRVERPATDEGTAGHSHKNGISRENTMPKRNFRSRMRDPPTRGDRPGVRLSQLGEGGGRR